MVSLEQVKLLESKVTNTIEYVKKVTGENTKLKEKLNSYQKRIEDLEVLVQQFKETQGRIEDGILSALDKLNQFEDALENKLSNGSKLSAESPPPTEGKPPIKSEPPTEIANAPESVRPKACGSPAEAKAPPSANTQEKDNTSDTVDGELDIF